MSEMYITAIELYERPKKTRKFMDDVLNYLFHEYRWVASPWQDAFYLERK